MNQTTGESPVGENDAAARLARSRWESEDHEDSWDDLASTFRAFLIGQVEDETAQGTVDLRVEQARELAGVDAATAAALASIVGDEFGIEMITPWGDRWIWVK